MPEPTAIRVRFRRLAAFVAAAALASCAADSTPPPLSGVAPADAAQPPPAAQAPTARPIPAGRGHLPATAVVSTPEAEPAPQRTIEQARAHCWSMLDRDRKAPRELEKRAVMVEKCAEERMKLPAPTE